MIVYRELNSLLFDLGFSAKELYSISNHTEKHYHRVLIPKGTGESRTLYVPDEQLKRVQRRIAETLLPLEPISGHACAYRFGGSTLKNALPHVGNASLLKLDIRHFFDSITYALVKEYAFPEERYSEANRVLLSMLCCFDGRLPQGAPSSPAISNIVMRGFDEEVAAWCRDRSVRYTRYCDDMSFSGPVDRSETVEKVKTELLKLGLFLNTKKTVFVRSGQRKMVTGIVVNEKPSVPSEYKKKLRQEVYYCKRFGVSGHLKHTDSTLSENEYLQRLLGRIRYAIGISPKDKQLRRLFGDALKLLKENAG